MSENYIVINGKKAELTEEQMKALGIEEKPVNPFVEREQYVYTIVEPSGADKVLNNPSLRENGLAFNDKDFAVQVALHQLLYRKLLKYAYDTDTIREWNDKIDEYGDMKRKYYIMRNYSGNNKYIVTFSTYYKDLNTVYFCSLEAALNAIDIVKSFEEEHPEFIW